MLTVQGCSLLWWGDVVLANPSHHGQGERDMDMILSSCSPFCLVPEHGPCDGAACIYDSLFSVISSVQAILTGILEAWVLGGSRASESNSQPQLAWGACHGPHSGC